MITNTTALEHMDEQALRRLAQELLSTVGVQSAALAERERVLTEREQLLKQKDLKIARLTQEISVYRRWRFDKRSEAYKGVQRSLFDEDIDADLAAMQAELKSLLPKTDKPAAPKDKAKRNTFPPELPRTEFHHEPETTTCGCGCALKRIGEDVSEKLDYTPGVFTVERHIRGKWTCAACQTLTQAPVPPHIIDKGIPTPSLLSQVLVAKYLDHLPLYRQERIFGRAGLEIPRSTLADWVGVCGVQLQPLVDALQRCLLKLPVLHADETPVQMLKPGSGKTHRAFIWTYASGRFEDLKAVIYQFHDSRSGTHAQAFLEDWQGSLVCDDYGGYKALSAKGVTEVGCMAHARRYFFDLYQASASDVAEQALVLFKSLYEIEELAKDLDAQARWRMRQTRSKPIAEKFHAWMISQRLLATDGTRLARALDYSLKRWTALVRFLDDGRLPIDNNRAESLIRPIAMGRSNWLFAGSLRAGKRAAAVMSLIQSAKLNGHDPYVYLKDILTRLPTHPNSKIEELLPHNWIAPPI